MDELTVVWGFDANVTFPARFEDITGSRVAPPLKSHSSSLFSPVLSWMRALGVRALNTFGEEAPLELLWTCGKKRPLHKRSQIDFVV